MAENEQKLTEEQIDWLQEFVCYFPYHAFEIRRLAKSQRIGEKDLLQTTNEILLSVLQEKSRCLEIGHPLRRSAFSVLSVVIDVFFADASTWKYFSNHGMPIEYLVPRKKRKGKTLAEMYRSQEPPAPISARLSKEYIETAWQCVCEACYQPLMALVGEMNAELMGIASVDDALGAKAREIPSHLKLTTKKRHVLLVVLERDLRGGSWNGREIADRISARNSDEIHPLDTQSVHRILKKLRKLGLVGRPEGETGFTATSIAKEWFAEDAKRMYSDEAIEKAQKEAEARAEKKRKEAERKREKNRKKSINRV